ncbi:MAG: peptidylprolyl isomerase [Bacteroidota bacterium]
MMIKITILNKLTLYTLLTLTTWVISSFTPPKQTPVKEQLVEITTRYGKMVVKLYNETPLHRDNFVKLVKEGFYDSLLFHRVIPSFMIQGGDPNSKYAPAGKALGDTEVPYTIPAEFNKKLYHKRGALAAARNENPEKVSSGCQFYIVQGRPFKIEELSAYENQVNYNEKRVMFSKMLKSDSINAKFNDFTLRGDKEGLHKYMLSLQTVIDKAYAPNEFKFGPNQIIDYLQMGGAPHLDGNYTVFGEVVSGLRVLDSIAAQKTDTLNRPLVDLRMKMKLLK